MVAAAPGETAGRADRGMAQLLDRVRALSPLHFAILFAAFFSPYFLIVHFVQVLSGPGLELGRDFVAFYSAGTLALNGDAASAYDHAAMHAAQQQAGGMQVSHFPWFYPPVMFAFVAPLAVLPYPAALVVWSLAPLVVLLPLMWRSLRRLWAGAAILIFPGALQSLLAGQNGILSTLIIVGGLLNLERRPVLAGAILGLLSYKPHVAAAVYAALVIGRYWRALSAAIAVTFALALASLIVLGPEPWLAFLRETEVAKTFMEDGKLRWSFMVTPFAAARLAGLSSHVAYALQAIVACGALLGLFVAWRRNAPLDARAAVLVAVIPLISPYAFSYDLAILGLPLLWLLRQGFETGFRHDEIVVFALAWVIAPLGWLLAESFSVLLTPFVLVALVGVLLRRLLRGDACGDGRLATA